MSEHFTLRYKVSSDYLKKEWVETGQTGEQERYVDIPLDCKDVREALAYRFNHKERKGLLNAAFQKNAYADYFDQELTPDEAVDWLIAAHKQQLRRDYQEAEREKQAADRRKQIDALREEIIARINNSFDVDEIKDIAREWQHTDVNVQTEANDRIRYLNEAEEYAWILSYGSPHLKRMLALGHPLDRTYINERAEAEFYGVADEWYLDFNRLAHHETRANPSPQALGLAERLGGQVVLLTRPPANYDEQVDYREWADWYMPTEAVVVDFHSYDVYFLV